MAITSPHPLQSGCSEPGGCSEGKSEESLMSSLKVLGIGVENLNGYLQDLHKMLTPVSYMHPEAAETGQDKPHLGNTLATAEVQQLIFKMDLLAAYVLNMMQDLRL